MSTNIPMSLLIPAIKKGNGIIVSDSFTAANGTTLSGRVSDSGHTWTVNSGTWDIQSNAARRATSGDPNGDTVTVPAGVANGRVSVIMTVLPTSTNIVGVSFRLSNSSNWLIAVHSLTALSLFKNVAGTLTNLGSFSRAPSVGERIEAAFNDSSLGALINGVTLVSATDSFNQAETSHGLYSSTAADAGHLDDFRVQRA